MPEQSIRCLGKEWRLIRRIASSKALKPDILILEQDGKSLVAKDFRPRGRFARHVWGPLNLKYEYFILQKLAGIEGVPAIIGFEDWNCLLLSRVADQGIKAGSDRLDDDFFTELQDIVSRIHRRGVLHLDLGHKSNIMVDAAGRPKVIDFNISLYLPQNRFCRPLFRLLARIDNYSVLRLKHKYRPESTSPEERKALRRFLRLRRLWIFDGLVRRLTNLGKRKN